MMLACVDFRICGPFITYVFQIRVSNIDYDMCLLINFSSLILYDYHLRITFTLLNTWNSASAKLLKTTRDMPKAPSLTELVNDGAEKSV